MYFCILLFSILIFIQALTTFSSLNAVVNGKTLGEYLKLAYTGKVTLIGSAGSLVCGLISMLLGSMIYFLTFSKICYKVFETVCRYIKRLIEVFLKIFSGGKNEAKI